ncbi:S8 family serine peptidase [Devosia sp. A8/3-2]|nr:S8 family serine peptidase [Devosia sp. A8/3-2]
MPNARVRVVDPFAALDSGGERADTYALTRAIVHLLALEVDVINLSLAGSDNAVLAGVVALADTKGIPLVAAVGNAGARSQPLYPAAYGSVLAVTAIDTQKRVYRRAVQGAHVDIAAPGVDIPTAASISGMRPQTGTSFAAPFVTAAPAARLAAHPELPPTIVVEELTAAAEDLGTKGQDEVFGWGLLRSDLPCMHGAARPG